MEADEDLKENAKKYDDQQDQAAWEEMANAAAEFRDMSSVQLVQVAASLAAQAPQQEQRRAEWRLRVAVHGIWTHHQRGGFEEGGLEVVVAGTVRRLISTVPRTRRANALLSVKFRGVDGDVVTLGGLLGMGQERFSALIRLEGNRLRQQKAAEVGARA